MTTSAPATEVLDEAFKEWLVNAITQRTVWNGTNAGLVVRLNELERAFKAGAFWGRVKP